MTLLVAHTTLYIGDSGRCKGWVLVYIRNGQRFDEEGSSPEQPPIAREFAGALYMAAWRQRKGFYDDVLSAS
jgi:hypothetical protein